MAPVEKSQAWLGVHLTSEMSCRMTKQLAYEKSWQLYVESLVSWDPLKPDMLSTGISVIYLSIQDIKDLNN